MSQFSGYVKAAKDFVVNIGQSTRSVELLSDFSTEGRDKFCSQEIENIDKILQGCGEFLTPEQKDELNLAEKNCTDN